jgi:hypothetical protein
MSLSRSSVSLDMTKRDERVSAVQDGGALKAFTTAPDFE